MGGDSSGCPAGELPDENRLNRVGVGDLGALHLPLSKSKRKVQMNTNNQTTGGVPQILRILVAIDFSPHATNALAWARSLADAFGAKLVLLHVIDLISLAATGGAADTDLLHLSREEAHKCMGELKREEVLL